MKFLMFEYDTVGLKDVLEALKNIGHTYKCITTINFGNTPTDDNGNMKFDTEFIELFQKEIQMDNYDAVFTINYSRIVSYCCDKFNMKYISFTHDSPILALYSKTVLNDCNYIFTFDSIQCDELKKLGVKNCYYMPLAVNINRLDNMITDYNSVKNDVKDAVDFCTSDISFVGRLYDEKDDYFQYMSALPNYSRGYIKALIEAQLKIYGYNFTEEVLTDKVLKDISDIISIEPNKYDMESKKYIFSQCVLSKMITNVERVQILEKLSYKFYTKLYTVNNTDYMPNVHNMGAVDYYIHMPYVFNSSKINLNITLRSIKSGIPLRCFDIMGARGLLMSNYQTDFLRHFIPGEDLVLYESQEDLINKCDYYLKHESERQQIIENGYGKVKEFHSYERRLNEIFDVVFN